MPHDPSMRAHARLSARMLEHKPCLRRDSLLTLLHNATSRGKAAEQASAGRDIIAPIHVRIPRVTNCNMEPQATLQPRNEITIEHHRISVASERLARDLIYKGGKKTQRSRKETVSHNAKRNIGRRF
jgi:hypothetical protein